VALFIVLGISTVSVGCRGNSVPEFNGERAFKDLNAQMVIGNRIPGTEAHRECKAFLLKELKSNADSVEEQRFTVRQGSKTILMSNLIARFNPSATRKILLCAHWDTRPFSDQALTPEQKKLPVPGANDAASGVAVLTELARLFKSKAPAVGVVIVLFDGEDYGKNDANMLLGSKYFAKNHSGERYDGAVLLDMIGDKDLQIFREQNSEDNAKWLNDRIWKIASDLGYSNSFKDQIKYSMLDDHIPLQEAGIPAVDLIDFDYAYWHTPDDTTDKCSARSLKMVGEVISHLVYSF
jgi:hypothetical protein